MKKLSIAGRCCTATQRNIPFERWITGAAIAAILIPFGPIEVQAQQILQETFATDTLKDPATTADWNTTETDLRLPLATSLLPIDSLTNPFPPAASGSVVDASDTAGTRAVAIGDLNGDGSPDLVFGNSGANSVYFQVEDPANDPTGTFARGAAIPNDVGGNTRSVALADFNGDGHLDVVFAEFGQNQESRVFFNNGSAPVDCEATTCQVFTAGDFVDLINPAGALKGDSVAAGDIDNDGDVDIVVGADGAYVKVFRNDGFGEFADAEDVVDAGISEFNFFARAVLLGDLDRDGDLDLVAVREVGDARVYLNTAGVFGNPQSVGAGAVNRVNAPDSAALGDVDGDGFLDLIIGNDGTDTPPSPNQLFINSQDTSGGPIFLSVAQQFSDGQNTDGARFIDLDRDGDLDIVTADLSGVNTAAQNRVYINDPVANSPSIFPANGVAITVDSNVSKSLAVGDIDVDGAQDVAFANEGNSNIVAFNAGTASGTPADQLFATGLSLQVPLNPNVNLSLGVALRPISSGTDGNEVIEYWLSDDGGSTWVSVDPGRSVALPGRGNDVRWRIELNSPSPLLRPNVGELRLNVNTDPFFSSVPGDATPTGTDIAEDSEYTYNIVTDDLDPGNLLDIRAVDPLPAWLTLVDNHNRTAILTGTPLNEDVGPHDVTIEVVDGAGRSDTQSFTITVSNANDAPTVVAPTGDQVFSQGDDVNIDAAAAFDDADGDTLTYSATGLPASLAIDSGTGLISGTLTNDDVIAGPDFAVAVTADDGNGGTVDDTFTITVNDVNDLPTFLSVPVTAATEGLAYSYSVVVEDIDGDTVTISGSVVPAWLTLTDNGNGTASLAGTPGSSDIGAANVTLSANDGTTPVEQSFTITVVAAADAPVITILGDASVTVEQGDAYTDDGATALDAQDGDLTSSISTVNTVATDTVGTYSVTYTVVDSAGNTGQAQRTVEVVDTAAPVITLVGPATVTLTVGDTYADQGATADDGLNGDLTANIVVDNPVNTTTAGTYTVTYNVTDTSGNAAVQVTRTVTVNSPPAPPPPPPSSSGGGGTTSPVLLLLIAGIALVRQRRRVPRIN
jgi:hypothetical protein